MPNSDRSIVEACIFRWWDTTHTFQLPKCEIGITPLDFTMLTGIAIGGPLEPLPPYSDEGYNDQSRVLEFFPRLNAHIKKGCISGSAISNYLQDDTILQTLEPVQIARAFCFYVIGYVFFPNASNSCQVRWLSYLTDMHLVSKFDWGSAILSRIYSSLDVVCRKKIKSLNCMWQLIEFFFYEHIAVTCPLLQNELEDTFPRIHRWVKANHVERAKNLVRFNLDVTNQQLEMRSMHSIIWHPYANSTAMTYPINVVSLAISKSRYLLLDPQTDGNWYLGERCYKQIFGGYAIPIDLPRPISKISRDVFFEYQRVGWPTCTLFLRPCSLDEYNEYWAFVSKGPALAPLTRGVNIDVIGYASLVGDEVELPCNPRQLHGRVYDTQGPSASSQPPPSNWTYTICGSNSEHVTYPLTSDVPSIDAPPARTLPRESWRDMYIDATNCANQLRTQLLAYSIDMARQLKEKDEEIALLRDTGYRPAMDPDSGSGSGTQFDYQYPTQSSSWPALDDIME